MKTLTLFSADLQKNRNPGMEDIINNFCYESWNNLKTLLESLNYEVNIKLFKTSDPKVKSFNSLDVEEFKSFILAEYNNYFWIDRYLYIPNNLPKDFKDLNELSNKFISLRNFYPDKITKDILDENYETTDIELSNFINNLKILYKKPKISHIGIDVTNVCNLNCHGCNHLTPLAKNHWFIDLNYFEEIVTELNKKFDLNRIHLVGGEPLLHPKFIDLCRIIKKVNANLGIKVFTNGLFLSKHLSEADEINSLGVRFKVSSYEMIPEEELLLLKSKFNNLEGLGSKVDTNKVNFFKICYDLKGQQNYIESFNLCCEHQCSVMKNDYKIYLCPEIMNINYLEEYFNLKLPLNENERGLDIRKANSLELIQYLYNPENATCCRFCKVASRNKYKHLSPQKGNIHNLNEYV